jgi:PAS domain S-box-containing protein
MKNLVKEKINIVLIEDDQNQTFLIRESLDEEKYNISVIHDGREALNFLLSAVIIPDLVLMDYHLPNLDGLTIMKALKEKGIKHNIIFLTADYTIETAVNSINAGALEFIPKNARFVNNIPAIVDKAYQTVKVRAEREKFELALKESESRFKSVLEATKDGVFEWNRVTGDMHVSLNNASILGYNLDEFPVSHKDLFNLVHPDDKALLTQKFVEHLQLNTPIYEAEIRVLAKDGKYKWILERGIIAEKDLDGNPVRIIGTHSDISERKLNEEKILEANLRLTTLISNLPGIVYRCSDTDVFNKKYLGGRVKEITGYTSDELLSDYFRFKNITYSDDIPKVQELINDAVSNNADYEVYYRIVTKNNETRWVWDHGKAITAKDGSFVSLEGYIADITERKIAEEALKQSEEEKDIILDNSYHAFVLLNPKGQVIAHNKVANHRTILMVGKSIKKGSDFVDFFPKNEKQSITEYFLKVLRGEPAYWEQLFVQRGDIIWYENVLVPIFISREVIKFVCFTSTDVTERKLAEEKIKYSEYLYNTTINSLNDLLLVIDINFDILLANEALIRFNMQRGFTADLTSKKIFDIYPFFKQYEAEMMHDVFESGKEMVWEESMSDETKLIYFDLKITPIYQSGKVIRAVIFIRDITERKNFEKRIMSAIIETEERERKRFSEDLHDELGSLLSTIKIYINTIMSEKVEIDKRAGLVDITNQLINQAIDNSKEIANNLSPNIIKRFGLISAVQSFCDKIQTSNNIHIIFDAENYSHKLREDQEISVYRIIAEFINNTIKHAHATQIQVVFESSGNNFTIVYSDNGKGFDFENHLQSYSKGLGLQNITSRINSLNGTFAIDSLTTNGFSIKIELLLPQTFESH